MPALSRNQHGMLLVVIAMAVLVANDTAMKLGSASLPA